MVTEENGWTINHLKSNAVKYAYNDNQWVTYDDQETITEKVYKSNSISEIILKL